MEKTKFNKKIIGIISSIIIIIILIVVGIVTSNNNTKREAEEDILNQLKNSRNFEGFEIKFDNNTYTITAPEGSIEEESLLNEMQMIWMLKSNQKMFGKDYNYEETYWYQTEKKIETTSKNILDELGTGYTLELWRLSQEKDEDNLLIQATDGEIDYNYVFNDIAE